MGSCIGFSGRAAGMTTAQMQTLKKILDGFSGTEALHNNGVGADQDFSWLANELGLRVGVTDATLTPMARNRALVASCTQLIAAPPTDFLLKKGSGTWETIKYAWKAGKPTLIILSDGTFVVSKDNLPQSPIPEKVYI